MFRTEPQFYKLLFWTVEQATHTKYQYDPDTTIYNQPSKMQEAKQTHTTKWYKRGGGTAKHQPMKPMLSFTYYVKIWWYNS